MTTINTQTIATNIYTASSNNPPVSEQDDTPIAQSGGSGPLDPPSAKKGDTTVTPTADVDSGGSGEKDPPSFSAPFHITA
jgi:hypothetical protein